MMIEYEPFVNQLYISRIMDFPVFNVRQRQYVHIFSILFLKTTFKKKIIIEGYFNYTNTYICYIIIN